MALTFRYSWQRMRREKKQHIALICGKVREETSEWHRYLREIKGENIPAWGDQRRLQKLHLNQDLENG